ncbi:hypothetical protein HYDPIDRAFT_116587 [Hydnomerulius pinastri MD-312]|uniref:Protein kinase domain-containing protein n=1 Tax=Hydnomerulius pinastri MD-312 TaxID=994086 RepID=A0A0C9WBK2_9AGAM|nr:hypothetical protein HYDPIDRAFT_116587 [Hydnomerulius pinastri MD-312]
MSSSTSESAPLTTPRGLSGVPPPSPLKSKGGGGIAPEARMLVSGTDTFGGVDVENGEEEEDERDEERRQSLQIPLSHSPASMSSPLSSSQPSSGLQHPLLTSLQPYIVPLDPSSRFVDLVEIAEGESGSVFAARAASTGSQVEVQPQEGTDRSIPAGTSHVAIKRIPLPPLSTSPSLSDDSPLSSKLASLLHELMLLRNLEHEHLLLLDGVYVGPGADDEDSPEPASVLDTSLWIRMELMERSLADVVGLVGEGLALQERMVGRFSSDVLLGLEYLQKQHIAHRDVRSDNLLLNAGGVVKLADFSNAIRVTRNAPTVTGAVGVVYWQAPEMRAGPYNALKVDVWSLGATVWELAETVPPFSMPASPSTQTTFSVQSARHVGSQWPPLTHPEHYSRVFHEFLKLCGREAAGRPGPGELLNTPFIRNACGRAVILQLLSQCRSIEESMVAREAES